MIARSHRSDLVDAHFAGRRSRADEVALRAHLPLCEACRRRYDRHLVLAELDPRAPTAEDRLGRGLGLGRVTPARSRWFVLGPLATAAVVLALWWPSARRDAPVTRGAATPAALFIYRVGANGIAEPAGARVHAGDELAFAYANPTDKRYLLVYGVDEHGHVYWFHPAWGRGERPPVAVAASPGVGPHELPEAVRHDLDGAHLDVRLLLLDEPLGVDEIERRVREGSERPGGGSLVERGLEVGR
jgi:hypothetical protein